MYNLAFISKSIKFLGIQPKFLVFHNEVIEGFPGEKPYKIFKDL